MCFVQDKNGTEEKIVHMHQTKMRYYCRKLNTIEVPIHYIAESSGLKFKSVTEALRMIL